MPTFMVVIFFIGNILLLVTGLTVLLFGAREKVIQSAHVHAESESVPLLWFTLLLARLSNRESTIWVLANNPNLSTNLVRRIYGRGRASLEVTLKLASHPSTPVDVLKSMGEFSKTSDIQKVLLNNSNVPETTRTFWALTWGTI